MKTLLFDIETTPNISYTWGMYEQNVIRFVKEWDILCFAFKWLDGKKVEVVWSDKTDEKLVKRLWELFDEADVVIAHNGKKFDVKKANSRFAYYGLGPPSPYKVVDTREVAKRYLAQNSNKLDDLGAYFGLGRKVEHEGFDLWLKCIAGDTKAKHRMSVYNKQDVVLLEKIYLKLRPFMVNHPEQHNAPCGFCGSKRIQLRGFSVTKKRRRQRYQCQDCGIWGLA